MNEIPKILESKEKILFEGKPRYAPYILGVIFGSIIVGAFIGVFAGIYLKSTGIGLIAGLAILMLMFIIGNFSYKVTNYALTNKRIIFQSGIIGRDFHSINYDEIKSARVEVGILGVIFHVGNVMVFSGEMASTGGKNSHMAPVYHPLKYIENPYDVLKSLQEHLSAREESLYK